METGLLLANHNSCISDYNFLFQDQHPSMTADISSQNYPESTSYFNKRSFWIFIGVIALIGFIITPQYGISGDEVTQHNYGIAVWNYLKTFGEDKTAVTGKLLDNTQTYYGGLFDGFAAMIADVFHPADIYLVRHYLNFLFGLMALIFCGLLAKEVGGWRAACIAVLLLLLTPRFFGEMFNNPKDIPFAGTYALGIYAIVRWLKHRDELQWKRTILMGLAIALGLSIRIGGLLLVGYLIIFWAISLWQSKRYDNVGKQLVHIGVAALIGYLGASIFWPYGWEDPIGHPMEALKVMSAYPLTVRMLFEGVQTSSTELPWYYPLKMLGITLPIALMLAFLGSIVVFASKNARKAMPYLWMMGFAAVFPIVYIIYKKSVLYDGIRHMLFALPLIAVCAGLALDWMFYQFRNRSPIQIGIAALVGLLLLIPTRFMVMAHPNQYVYFNPLVGGLPGAYGYYETDYYMNSIKQGYDWLMKHEGENIKNSKDTLLLVTNGLNPINESYFPLTSPKLHLDYSRYYERNTKNWDYAIYFNRFLDREQLLNGYYPGADALHVIEADGVPLCVVLKNNPKRNGFLGYQALQAGDTVNALIQLKAATVYDPKNMESWTQLALAAALAGDTITMRNAMDKSLSISSIDLNTSGQLGELALTTQSLPQADRIYTALIKEYPDQVNGYLGMAQSIAIKGDLNGALQKVNEGMAQVQKAIEKAEANDKADPQALASMSQCYQLSSKISMAMGNVQAAQNAAAQAKNYMQQAQMAAGQ